MSSGRITFEEVLAAFENAGTVREPVTASEVGDQLGCARRTALNKLEELAERGDLRSKQVGAESRVWWQPVDATCSDGHAARKRDKTDDSLESSSTKSEESLSNSSEYERLKAELDEVFGRVSDGFYALDNEWRITYASERAKELINSKDTDLVGENIWDVFKDVADTKLSEEYQTAMETQEPTSFEIYDEQLDAWYEVHTYPSETGLSVYFRDVTEQKERKRELEKSERRYRTLVEHFPNGAVALVDENLHYRTVGGNPLDVADVPIHEVEDRPVGEVLPPALSDELVPRYESALEGESSSFETEYNDSIFEFQFVPVWDSDGSIFAALGMSQDITDRKENERKIAESERRYRTLIENFPNGSAGLFDEDLRYIAVGGQLLDTLDLSPEERIGRRISEIHSDDLLAEIEPYFRAALEGEANAFEVEYRGRHLFAQTVPVRNAADEVDAGMLVVQDVTERREAQRELRESEAKFRMLAENLDEIVWMAAPDAEEWLYINPAFEDIWGLDREQLYDDPLSFLEAVHPDDREHVREEFTALPESEFDDEFRIVRPDGEVRWIHAQGTKVHDEDGDLFRIVGTGEDITERKRMEANLRQERNLKDQIVETSPVGIAVVGADGTIQFANEHAEDLYGRSREELDKFSHDDPRWDLVDENGDSLQTGETPFNRVLTREEPIYDQVIGLRRPSGERVWVSVNGAPQWNEAGKLERAVFVFEDVTERRETQRQLVESEHRYRTLAENFPNGAVGLYDHDLRYTLVEGAIWDEIEPDAEDLEGTVVTEALQSPAAEDLEQLFRMALKDGEIESVQTEFAGQTWRVWATPLRDADGEIFAGLSFSLDITEQVERERELERALDLLDRTERIADVGGWEIDVDTQDVFWTDHVFELLEVDADEEPPLDEALDMYHKEDKSIVEDAVENALASGEPFDVEVRVRTDSGEMRWLRLQGVPETDDGDIVSFRGAAQDVTEMVERERELEERNDRLESFASMLAHELRNPVTIGQIYSQQLPDDTDSEAVEYVTEAFDRIENMVDVMLVLTRGREAVGEQTPIRLADIAQAAWEDVDAPDATVAVDIDYTIQGDETYIRHLFQNLFENAVEHGGGDVTITVGELPTGFYVADDGPGIPVGDRDAVFKPGFTTAADQGGTGLGLAFVEKLVDVYEWECEVTESTAGGARFEFTNVDEDSSRD